LKCSLVVSRGSQAIIVSMAFSCSVLWHQVHVLTLTENMGLCIDPLSRPYAEYLLRIGNGQKLSIIDHFPPKANVEPSIGVEIALYPKIHQAPSLDTFIHVVFLTLVIHYINCHNPSLGLATKARGCKVAAKWETQEHSTCSQECKKCEGMSPHTPK
jgi:hypothetical protein